MRRAQSEPRSQSRQVQDSRKNMSNINASSFKQYESSIENYLRNEKQNQQRIDPKGIAVSGVFISISGVIQQAQVLYSRGEDTLKVSYEICVGGEWHDETPNINDKEGSSNFSEAKNGKALFSLGFDCLLSCMYVLTWPQLVMKFTGFDSFGNEVTRGYAQLHLPYDSGQKIVEAYIYEVIREQSWYHRWLPFFTPKCVELEPAQFRSLIVSGSGRQVQKIRSIGVVKVRAQTLLRNLNRYGYT